MLSSPFLRIAHALNVVVVVFVQNFVAKRVDLPREGMDQAFFGPCKVSSYSGCHHTAVGMSALSCNACCIGAASFPFLKK